MKVFVTLAGKEYTVDLEGDRAVVHAGGEVIPVVIDAPGSSSIPSEGAEALVIPEGDGCSPLHVAFWGSRKEGNTVRLLVDGVPVDATLETERDRLRGRLATTSRASGPVRITSPLPGVIRQVFVFPGNEVAEGTPIMTLEAMKMENEIRAETGGTIEALHVEEGQVVNAGDRLCEIRTSEGSAPA